MAIDTTWTLLADVLPSLTVTQETEDEQGVVTATEVTFTKVVRVVYWTCVAFEGDETETLTGAVEVPVPTSLANYIPLDDLAAMDEGPRRVAVLAWAEIINPGFVAATEARAEALLLARQSQTALTQVDIL